MNGHIHPLNVCGDDCCGHHGGMQCRVCGLWYCTLDINGEGLCDECAEINDKQNNNNEE